MKKVAVILAIVAFLATGCSTIAAYKDTNATAATKKAALCSDAQMGYTMSMAMLDNKSMTQAESVYWNAYKVGASLALTIYCPAQ